MEPGEPTAEFSGESLDASWESSGMNSVVTQFAELAGAPMRKGGRGSGGRGGGGWVQRPAPAGSGSRQPTPGGTQRNVDGEHGKHPDGEHSRTTKKPGGHQGYPRFGR